MRLLILSSSCSGPASTFTERSIHCNTFTVKDVRQSLEVPSFIEQVVPIALLKLGSGQQHTIGIRETEHIGRLADFTPLVADCYPTARSMCTVNLPTR